MLDQLEIGDIVHLNSGGPNSEVVSRAGDTLTVQWRNGKQRSKLTLPRSCFSKSVRIPLVSASCRSTAFLSQAPEGESQTSTVATSAD